MMIGLIGYVTPGGVLETGLRRVCSFTHPGVRASDFGELSRAARMSCASQDPACVNARVVAFAGADPSVFTFASDSPCPHAHSNRCGQL